MKKKIRVPGGKNRLNGKEEISQKEWLEFFRT